MLRPLHPIREKNLDNRTIWIIEHFRRSSSKAHGPAAASIKVIDGLFGFPARNDAECCKRELLGRSWRRDWGMHDFR